MPGCGGWTLRSTPSPTPVRRIDAAVGAPASLARLRSFLCPAGEHRAVDGHQRTTLARSLLATARLAPLVRRKSGNAVVKRKRFIVGPLRYIQNMRAAK